MNIVIAGLPDETIEHELREALTELGCPLVKLLLINSSYPNKTTAVVELSTDKLGCDSLAKRINGHFWHGHKLRAERPLFGNK